MASDVVFRFAIVSADGRRSGEWRVWTGRRKPTDDVYITPRSTAGTHKISLHKDGYCQHGPEARLRAQLPPGTRAAFDRWDQGPEVVTGWRIGYVLAFHDSQLVASEAELGAEVEQLPAPPADQGLQIVIAIADVNRPLHDTAEFRVVGRLRRESGGAVAIGYVFGAIGRGPFEECRNVLLRSASGRTFPTPLSSDQRFAWGYSELADGVRMALEVAAPWELQAARFNGALKVWDELPEFIQLPRGVDPCGVLYVPPAGTAQLFVNDLQPGCIHHGLTGSANNILSAVRGGSFDGRWQRLADGGHSTLLLPAG